MCSCGRDNAVHDRSDIEPGDPEDDCCTISRSRRSSARKQSHTDSRCGQDSDGVAHSRSPQSSFGPRAKTKSNELPEGHGPLPGARNYLQRAAEAGSADAGYALGTTYDPSFIEETGARGIRGDFYRHGRGTSERRSSVRKPHKKGFGNWNRLGQWLPNGRMSRGRT